MAKGFNVDEFKSVYESNGGLKRMSHFLLEIPVPRGLTGVISNEGLYGTSTLSFYAKSGMIPGIGILSEDIYRYGYGPIERKPYSSVVNDMLVNFYVDNSNVVRKWFDHWIRLIINHNSSKGMNGPPTSLNGASPYEFSYKEEYAVDITVCAFDAEGNETTRVVLVEAFPNFIGDIAMDWQAKNVLMTMPVAINYRDWYEETMPIRDEAKPLGRDETFIPSIIQKDPIVPQLHPPKFEGPLPKLTPEES